MAAVRSKVGLSLGLMNTSVNVLSTQQSSNDVRLKTLCQNGHPPTATQQKLRCPNCGNDDRSSFVKGKEVAGGYVIVDESVIASSQAPESEKSMISVTCHPADQVTTRTVPGDKAYFLAPALGVDDKVYALIAKLVHDHWDDLAFCAVFAVKGVSALYRLGTYGNALTLLQLAWPGDTQAPPAAGTDFDAALLPLAEQFIGGLTVDFDPERFVDQRAATLRDFIASQEVQPGAEVPVQAAKPAAADPNAALIAALQAAVDAQAPAPAAPAAPAKAPRKAPAKRTPRKAPAKS